MTSNPSKPLEKGFSFNKEKFIDIVHTMHLQNTSGRESEEEMFKLGISAAFEELTRLQAGRCSSCKHWVDNDYVLKGYSDRHKMCNVATEDDSGGFMDAICSGEGIGGELITRDDFGCVLHKAR